MDRYKPGQGAGDSIERKESGTHRISKRAIPVVVFADDSAVQSLKLQELLEGAGYCAVGVSDGRSAILKVEELNPDLVILDLEMPGMGGAEACGIVKKSRSLSHIPVLMFTAHEHAKYLVSAFDAGCDGYMLKGTPDSVLLQKIARHLSVEKASLKRAE